MQEKRGAYSHVKEGLCLTKRVNDKIFSTGEFHSLAVDDEVRQLLSNLSTLLLVLRKVELLAQLHVEHLQVQGDTGHEKHSLQYFT